jgi:hypothetical protein
MGNCPMPDETLHIWIPGTSESIKRPLGCFAARFLDQGSKRDDSTFTNSSPRSIILRSFSFCSAVGGGAGCLQASMNLSAAASSLITDTFSNGDLAISTSPIPAFVLNPTPQS